MPACLLPGAFPPRRVFGAARRVWRYHRGSCEAAAGRHRFNVHQDRIQVLQEALQRTAELRPAHPDYWVLESIQNQLTYLLALETGTSNDRSRFPQINLALLAVREIWDLDDRLYELLSNVSAFVKYIQAGE